MEQVAHQTIVMQFILELAKSLKVDPRACFRQFFTKIKVRTGIFPLGTGISGTAAAGWDPGGRKGGERGCGGPPLTPISRQTADQQYMEGFNDELEAFKERVRGRAKVRIEKAMKEYEEEERQKRLGPGGLDPVEVYESLPAVSIGGFLGGKTGKVRSFGPRFECGVILGEGGVCVCVFC